MTDTQMALTQTKKNALLLTAFAAACTLLVALTHLVTAPVIEEQKQLDILNKLTEVLDTERFDNNPLENCTYVSNKALTGVNNSVKIYRATLQSVPYALVYQTQTQKGYNGRIELMAAVTSNGTIEGVRTVAHQETPGLGDKIEVQKSDWIKSFTGLRVKSEEDSKWAVKKDGGQFDQFTGATITPRAVVNQIKESSLVAQQLFDDIFAQPNECAPTQVTE